MEANVFKTKLQLIWRDANQITDVYFVTAASSSQARKTSNILAIFIFIVRTISNNSSFRRYFWKKHF